MAAREIVDVDRAAGAPARGARWRIAWTLLSFSVVEVLVCGLSMLPVVLSWTAVAGAAPEGIWRVVILGLAIAPSYVVFALCLMGVSPLVTRAAGWRTPPDEEMRIEDFSWPLLNWARYMASIHLVRVLAGFLFRGSPIWTAYLRLHGARIGRRVYVASLGLSDYNLLEIGDDTVIGDGVHVSGHTVEDGLVKTAAVRVGRNVTIGLNSIVDIGVEIGDECQVAALSFVPKHAKLEPGSLYGGVPARRLR